MSSKTLLLSFAMLFSLQLSAQNAAQKVADFSDKTPSYTLSENYEKQRMVTQVVYTETATIVHHSYLATYIGGLYYLGVPHQEERWVLQNKANPKEIFALTEIRNIRKNGILLKESLKNEMSIYYDGETGDVFTCEVHFPRLPKHVKVVDMLEGLTLADQSHRFHAFNLKLVPRPEPVVAVVPVAVVEAKKSPEAPLAADAKKPFVGIVGSDTQITVYPNPAQDKIFIRFDKNQTFNIDIIDALGKTMISNAGNEIVVKDWQRGVYFAKFSGKQGTFTKKFVLE